MLPLIPIVARASRAPLLITLALFHSQAHSASPDAWRSTLAPREPGAFPPLPPTTAAYRIEWSGALAARANITLGSGTMHATAFTTGLARTLWKLDARFESSIHPDTLLPTRVEQREAYSKSTITTRLAFTPDSVTRSRVESPRPRTPHKTKRFKYPRARDFHAAFLFARSHPLAVKDRLRFVVFAGSDGYLATVTVTTRENISLNRVKFPAIRCDLSLQKLDRKKGLLPHAKFQSATIWLSDDHARIPLKARVQIHVGTVTLELDSSTPPIPNRAPPPGADNPTPHQQETPPSAWHREGREPDSSLKGFQRLPTLDPRNSGIVSSAAGSTSERLPTLAGRITNGVTFCHT